MDTISAVVITRNEEVNLARCLQSVREVVEEIIVVDSGSTDATVEIAAQLGAKVDEFPWRGFASARNRGMELASHPYVLTIDADEVMSPELQRSVRRELGKGLSGAYTMNRRSNYAGTWVRFSGWYPDVKLRLYPREGSRWTGEYVHERIVLRRGTEVVHLQGDLLHYAVDSAEDHLAKARNYAHLGSEELRVAGKRVSVFIPILSAILRFLRIYLLQLGFLDGKVGWLIATISAKSVYWKYHWLRMSATPQQRTSHE
jgi:(heptosyl)LPS beta-1,4-glucosyltransferase